MGLTERALRELMRILETGKFPSDDSAASDLYFAVREALENRRILSDRTAERDQLRAQLETASGNARLYADRCEALEAEVERLRGEAKAKEDGFWGRMAGKCANERDIATARAEASEKDAADCRAEYRDLFAKAGAMSDKLIAAESTVSGLRLALEKIGGSVPPDGWTCLWCGEGTAEDDCGKECPRTIAQAALAASPDEHERRIKSEALREMARLFMATANSDLSYHNRDLAARFCNAAASELEAANG